MRWWERRGSPFERPAPPNELNWVTAHAHPLLDKKKPPEGGFFSASEQLLLDGVFGSFHGFLASISSRSTSVHGFLASVGSSSASGRCGSGCRGSSARRGFNSRSCCGGHAGNGTRDGFHRCGNCRGSNGSWRRNGFWSLLTASSQSSGSNHSGQDESFVHFKVPEELIEIFPHIANTLDDSPISSAMNHRKCCDRIDRARARAHILLKLYIIERKFRTFFKSF